MTAKFRIGTRNSPLARWQTDRILHLIKEYLPDLSVEIVPILTTGDKITNKSFAQIGDQGLFTKEIEIALIENRIDAAVHSMKDLESVLADGLIIGAVPERADVRDVFISRNVTGISSLPEGGRVLTGSLRRRAQLLNIRPDILIEDIRGNVATRLSKFYKGGADALIMAAAGMKRLGLEKEISGYIPIDNMLPAVGQGALAIEIRQDDETARSVCKVLNDTSLYKTVAAERSFLRELHGGCRVPIAGYAEIIENRIELTGMLASLDGRIMIKEKINGGTEEGEELGRELGEKVLSSGGKKILEEFRDL